MRSAVVKNEGQNHAQRYGAPERSGFYNDAG